MKRKVVCVFRLAIIMLILSGCAKTDETTESAENMQEAVETETAEIESDNIESGDVEDEIYYLSESYLIDRLNSFISFCRYYAEPSIEHKYWNGDFSQLVEITMNTISDIGIVKIYETNSNLILTEDFAKVASRKETTSSQDFFKAVQNIGLEVSFYGSNIHEDWHYYAGTDEKAYVGVKIGNNSFIVEMAQCAGSPNDWIISGVFTDSEAHDKLWDKLVNEDGVEWETQPTLNFADLYKNYIDMNVSGESGFYMVDSNNDDIPECICRVKGSYGKIVAYTVLVADTNGEVFRYDITPEYDKISGGLAAIEIYFDEESGHFYTTEYCGGECHIRSSVSGDYFGLVDYSNDLFVISYVDEYDTTVSYGREWHKEYS